MLIMRTPPEREAWQTYLVWELRALLLPGSRSSRHGPWAAGWAGAVELGWTAAAKRAAGFLRSGREGIDG